MLPFRKLQRGFTLIEMLVVIAIISILIGIGINTFTIAQQKARDVRRKADLRQLQTALELFKQDKGQYPGSFETLGDATKNISLNQTWPAIGSSLNTLLVNQGYLGQPLTDPKNDTTYYYTYSPTDVSGNANGATAPSYYVLRATLENMNDPDLTGTNTWHGQFWGNGNPRCNSGGGYCLMGGQ